MQSGSEQWISGSYCEHCRQFQDHDDLRCSHCGLTYRNFSSTGLLGCAFCYESFAVRLDPLIEKYQLRTPGEPFRVSPSSLARARAQTVRDAWKKSSAEKISPIQDWISGKIASADSAGSIFLSGRVRYARNVAGLPFLSSMDRNEKAALAGILLSLNSSIRGALNQAFPIEDIDWMRRGYCDDEDHFRMEWIFSASEGSRFLDFFEKAYSQVNLLDCSFDWSCNPTYGFLTACPGNCGLGLRSSIMISLPREKKRKWEGWIRQLREAGFTVRGKTGENSSTKSVIQVSCPPIPRGANPIDEASRMMNILDVLLKRI